MTNRKSEIKEFSSLIDSLHEGDLTEVQWLRIRELVCANPSFREEYCIAMQLIVGLELECADATDPIALANLHLKGLPRHQQLASAALLPEESPGGSSTDNTPTQPTWLSTLCLSSPRANSWLAFSPAVIAALVLVAFGFALAKRFGEPSPAPLPKYVATLRSVAGTTWRGMELPTKLGSRLVPGTLQLHSGVVEVEFDSGAIVVLRGPATLDIHSRDSSFLHRGKMLAHVPPPAIGFTVETLAGTVVDLGTDFGIVAASGIAGLTTTEVHVFEGEVDLAAQTGGASLAPKRRLVKGEAARLEFQEEDKNKQQSSFSWHSIIADRKSFSGLGFMVPLQNATSNASQTVKGILGTQYMIDSDSSTGWAVGGYQGSNRTAVVETETDLGFVSGTLLTFTLEHDYRISLHNLGRFRLSVTTDDRSTFADGYVQGGDVTANWVVLDPLALSSRGGATMTEQGDHSLLLSEANPDNDTYMVTAQTKLTGITGFRLEVLADDRLPSGGPGRHPNGNFVLTHFGVMAAPLDRVPKAQLVALPKPTASRPKLVDYDPSAQIRFATPAEADAKRQELIDFVWPGGLPTAALPQATSDISFPEGLSGVARPLVAKVDQLDFTTDVAGHQLPSSGYLLSPAAPAATPRLGIVHQGHQAGTAGGLDSTIDYLLGQGFHVAVLQMPLFGGNSTEVTLPDGSVMTFGSSTSGHSNMFSQFSGKLDGGMFAFFLEPVVQTINLFVDQNPSVQDITMIGLSGGGWTTHMAAAIDTRIDLSIAVAGSLPLYARPFSPGSAGDAEQKYAPLYHEIDAVPDANNALDTADGVASWLEIYALGGYGEGRRQIQVLNYNDTCCFSGDVHETYDDFVSDRVDSLGLGDWDFVSDVSHHGHMISEFTINSVLASAIFTRKIDF